ncbi:cytochrome c biogenesis protein CcdA [Patescibacteria group bacterium]|nr:cytochrome c biogenesis protein CcdA [Patescibacteria group bacterium]
MLDLSLIGLAGPAFLAGVLTFLAPCTLPLLPGYLGFISGLSFKDWQDGPMSLGLRWRVFKNGLWYVLGFSLVFVVLGGLVGWAGSGLGSYRFLLARWGGLLVIFFGLFLLWGDKWSGFGFLQKNSRWSLVNVLQPGRPLASFLFGVVFAFGWTPCVGPILGSILLLASSQASLGTGALLLLIFAAGLAVPFLVAAISLGSIGHYLHRWGRYLRIISYLGGLFLIGLGVLMVWNKFDWWVALAYKWLGFINYNSLLNFL